MILIYRMRRERNGPVGTCARCYPQHRCRECVGPSGVLTAPSGADALTAGLKTIPHPIGCEYLSDLYSIVGGRIELRNWADRRRAWAVLGGFAFRAKLPAQQIFLIATLPLTIGLIAMLAIMPLYQRHVRMVRADPN
jgi:hypothetical protein